MNLLSILCDFWWLPWLLPFILGFLAAWLWRGQLKTRIEELEGDLNECQSLRANLKSEYDVLNTDFSGLQGEHSLLSNRFNELDRNYSNLKSELAVDKKSSKTKSTKKSSKKTDIINDLKSGKISAVKGSLNYDVHAKLKNTNLQIIEGIGPKMEEVLKNNGISNWGDLSKQSSDGLRNLLDSVNPRKYKIINPTTWPQQAKLAYDANWNVLTDFQRNLDTGKTNTLGGTDAKVEKMLIRLGFIKKWKKDDLKAIEGIGPKIEKIFKEAGIDTWKKLSESSVDLLKSALKDAGDRFRLADPGTWPEQARMANEGLWDDLREYQDFLQGGK